MISGDTVPPRTIANRLKFVLNDAASDAPAEFPLGVLTTENRDTWAEVREHLVQTHNATALDTIDSALFLVSLDDKANYSALGEIMPVNPIPIVQNMLHGDSNGLINRWFDKSLSLIVCKDGNAGVNFEHSWGDGMTWLEFLFCWIYYYSRLLIKLKLFVVGVAVLRYFNEIYKDTTTKAFCQPSDAHNNLVEDVGDDIFKIGKEENTKKK